ncbi:MAG TPA: aminoglycoside phosphotransferase, partial [Burkholderiaceae bacterium]|nr:aminoglycoside phosphotransferase [Burkholderiaceae bacterium]
MASTSASDGARGPASPVLIEALRRRLQSQTGRAVRLVETHISWVLLDGQHAWKIKKPVRLGFLDFADLETRRRYCLEEFRLNRRLAPEIYEAVVALRGSPEDPRIDEAGVADADGDAAPENLDNGHAAGSGPLGPPIEYALRMKQFAAGALFSEKIADGSIETSQIDRFAERIAAFHESAARAGSDSSHGSPEEIAATIAQLLTGLDTQLGADRCAGLRAWLDAERTRLRPIFQQRRADGWIRECHGDLHLANVVVLDDQVTAFDCIEFDPSLRWIDVQCDIAFLFMDLIAHERADLAYRFLDAWLQHSGDHAGVDVLRFNAVYRALVRALVATIRRSQGFDTGGADYFALAARLAGDRTPRLAITHGL